MWDLKSGKILRVSNNIWIPSCSGFYTTRKKWQISGKVLPHGLSLTRDLSRPAKTFASLANRQTFNRRSLPLLWASKFPLTNRIFLFQMLRYSGIHHLKDEFKSDFYEMIFSAQSFSFPEMWSFERCTAAYGLWGLGSSIYIDQFLRTNMDEFFHLL